jgi:hypothetical protein
MSSVVKTFEEPAAGAKVATFAVKAGLAQMLKGTS